MILQGQIVRFRIDLNGIVYAQVKVNPTDGQAYQVIFSVNKGESQSFLDTLSVHFIPIPGTGTGFIVSRP